MLELKMQVGGKIHHTPGEFAEAMKTEVEHSLGYSVEFMACHTVQPGVESVSKRLESILKLMVGAERNRFDDRKENGVIEVDKAMKQLKALISDMKTAEGAA